MTANKMPEPEGWLVRYGTNNECWNAYRDELTALDVGKQWRGAVEPLFTADQMRAMYLAGLEAAKACVPAEATSATNQIDRFGQGQFNRCREETLANLAALEQEAKK